MRSAITTTELSAWRQQHPLEATWNRCFAPYLERRARFRHCLRQRYMDYGKRGKGNKAWKRADAHLRSAFLLCWPDYLR